MKFKHLLIINLLVTCALSQELISFSSANPFGFRDIITALDDQENQEVTAVLRFPKGSGPFPLVIGVAGSLDWGTHHLEYLEMLRAAGIATLQLQSFSSRGISSTVGSQVEVTTAMMVLDSYKALDEISKDQRILNDKIGIMGWSLGGGVALFSGWLPLIEKISPENNFAAHLSIYPPCIAQPENPKFTQSPMHILIGELDDWVPAQACEEFVQDAETVGSVIGLTIFKNSHHSFDRQSLITINRKAYKTVDCRFKIRDDGTVLMGFMNIPMSSPILQKIGLGMCAKRGPTMGGNPEARAASFEFTRAFMIQHLHSK